MSDTVSVQKGDLGMLVAGCMSWMPSDVTPETSKAFARLLTVFDEMAAAPGDEDMPDGAPDENPSTRYALVEQMGHRSTVAAVREVTFCGKPMLAVTDLKTGSEHLISPESLYEVTWLTEDQARARAKPWTATAITAGDDPEVAENGGVWGFTEDDL
jgi:hypothetical protein